MYYENAEAGYSPQKVTLEKLPGSKVIVRLADGITKEKQEDQTSMIYRFGEVVFTLPEDKKNMTAEEIENDFATWWEYGKTAPEGSAKEAEETAAPEVETMTRAQLTAAVTKLQEQNAMLEECVLEMSEQVYA